MLKTALDLVPILEAIESVKDSKVLTKPQQQMILKEIAYAIPAPVFCKQCPQTLSIINNLVETTDGPQAKRTSKEETSENKNPNMARPPSKNPFARQHQTPEGRAKFQEMLRTRKNKGGRPLNVPDGYSKETIKPIIDSAKRGRPKGGKYHEERV